MKKITILLGSLLLGLVALGASCSSGASDGGVLRSGDVGETWEHKVYVGQQKKKTVTISDVNVEKIVFDPDNSNIIYLAGKSDGIYKTDSGGDQWRKLSLSSDRIRDIVIDPQYTNNIYTVKGNNIIKSVDSGETWEIVYTDAQGAIITGISIDWYNQQRIFAISSIGTILLSEDEGTNWKIIYQAYEPITRIIMDPSDSRVIYIMELERNIHKSTDGGATWTELFDADYKKANGNATKVKQLVMDPNNSRTLYISTPDGIYKSTDAGATWNYIVTLIEKGVDQNNSIANITIKQGSPEVIMFSVGKVIHKSVNAGVTWKTIENFPSTRRITTIATHPHIPDVIYAGTEKVEQQKKGFIR